MRCLLRMIMKSLVVMKFFLLSHSVQWDQDKEATLSRLNLVKSSTLSNLLGYTTSVSVSVMSHPVLIRFQKVLLSITQLPSDPSLILSLVKCTTPPNYSLSEFGSQIYIKMRVADSCRAHSVFLLFK